MDYTLSNINLSVPAPHADKLLAMGDGTCALLYLYALRGSGGFATESAARDLKRTPAEIDRAAEKLAQNGLLSNSGNLEVSKLPLPAEELPQYQAEDIASAAKRDPGFSAVVDETQKILGKTLSRTDVETLFGIYDHLGLPPEVIILLVNHCLENTRERMGPGKLPSMRTMEKEAYAWFNREILTLEQAEAYLTEKRRRDGLMGEIKAVLQINERNLSASERGYVESWLDMGFDSEAIALAYDKTVIKTGSRQWKYMNAVLKSWHSKGLHTVDEINRGDRRDAPNQPAQPQPCSGDDLEKLKKLLNRK